MVQIPQSRIVYHGTGLPPGSPSDLRPPTVDNPFFVASAPRIALSYLFHKSNGSLFVFRLRDIPDKISLNLYSREGVDALAGKLPRTGKLLGEFLKGDMGFGENPNFWLLSQAMVLFLECHVRTGKEESDIDWLMGDARERLSNIWYGLKKKSFSDFIPSLRELGIVSVKNGKMRMADPRMSMAMDKVDDAIGVLDYFDDEITNEQHAAGRIIKSRINKVAQKMGFLMVGDYDSSQITDYGQEHEYAVFDKSAFDYAVEKTIPEDEVFLASEALARGIDFKGSGMLDPNEKAQYVLDHVKDGWVRQNMFPKFSREGATELHVPETVTHISDFGLSDFRKLELVEFSEKTTNFGVFSLAHCYNLRKIVFKAKEFNRFGNRSVERLFSIGNHYDMRGLEIVVPEGFMGYFGDLEKKGVRITHG